MRIVLTYLFMVFTCSLIGQRAEHETFTKIIKLDKTFIDPQGVKVDTLRRTEVKNPLNYQLGASLASYLLYENRDTALRLSVAYPNLILLSEGTMILYWDGDVKSFQGTFIQDPSHSLLQTISASSRVYTMPPAALTDNPAPANETLEDHN